MKTVFGILLTFVDIAMIVAGLTCTIIACIVGGDSNLTAALQTIGFIGVGAGIGTCLTIFGVPLIWGEFD